MPADRRVGKRVEIAPVAITWTPAIAKQSLGRGPRPQPAHLIEVSVSGAQIISHSRTGIDIGTWMALDIDGYHALVEVRRIFEVDDGADFTFGVAFVLLAPDLQQKIARTVAQQLAPGGHFGASQPR